MRKVECEKAGGSKNVGKREVKAFITGEGEGQGARHLFFFSWAHRTAFSSGKASSNGPIKDTGLVHRLPVERRGSVSCAGTSMKGERGPPTQLAWSR